MISITIIYDYRNFDKENIIEQLRNVTSGYITTLDIVKKDRYDKIENGVRVILNAETKESIDIDMANTFLNLMSNSWVWDEEHSNAWSDSRKQGEFTIREIKFMNCWFEDLEN